MRNKGIISGWIISKNASDVTVVLQCDDHVTVPVIFLMGGTIDKAGTVKEFTTIIFVAFIPGIYLLCARLVFRLRTL